MDRQNILSNLEITCKQNDITIEDVIVQFITNKMIGTFDNKEINECHFNDTKKMLNEEQDSLWDLQPTIEDDEEHAFAVQHARDIYNILLGEF